MTDGAIIDGALEGAGVEVEVVVGDASELIVSVPSVLVRRRLITRFFLFLVLVVRDREPLMLKPGPELAKLTSDGRDDMTSLSEAARLETLAAPDGVRIPELTCDRVNAANDGANEGVRNMCSPYSPVAAPAQALKTVSRIEGVNNDRVLCESVRAASRRRFF